MWTLSVNFQNDALNAESRDAIYIVSATTSAKTVYLEGIASA